MNPAYYYLIPWPGPHVTPSMATLKVPGPIEIQSSPEKKQLTYFIKNSFNK